MVQDTDDSDCPPSLSKPRGAPAVGRGVRAPPPRSMASRVAAAEATSPAAGACSAASSASAKPSCVSRCLHAHTTSQLAELSRSHKTFQEGMSHKMVTGIMTGGQAGRRYAVDTVITFALTSMPAPVVSGRGAGQESGTMGVSTAINATSLPVKIDRQSII